MAEPSDVSRLLRAWRAGDEGARDQLVPLVYDELRRRAGAYLRRERAGHTLRPTALVNEAFVRLLSGGVPPESRAHFFAVASQVMRHILVEQARRRKAAKRGGGQLLVELEDAHATTRPREAELLTLDAALDELARLDPRQARLVELRYFGGLSVEETADVLAISPATVKREWASARAWLYDRVYGKG